MADGMMPNLTSEVAKTALVEAMAMSQAAARPMPPPSAAPWIRAMVVVQAVVGGALHPVEVGAGREAFSSSGEDDDADVIVFVEGDAGGGEFGDEDFVEGVVEIGAVHPDRGDRAGEFDLQCLEGHGLSPRIFYLLVWGMLDF